MSANKPCSFDTRLGENVNKRYFSFESVAGHFSRKKIMGFDLSPFGESLERNF
jgi:hypothetical protein